MSQQLLACVGLMTVLACGDHGNTENTHRTLARTACEALIACGLVSSASIEDCTGESELFCE